MPAERRRGMDHPHHRYSPIGARGALRWPDGASLALAVLVDLEHMEWAPPQGSYQSPILAGGLGRRPAPDYARLTHREYGHRVGIFRVLDVLERHGVPVTVAMDALTAEHYPYLVQHCGARGAEFVGHGISASRMITSRMSESEERAYIRDALHTLTKATGSTPRGWLGPEYGESARTPALLAEAGLSYVCDWVNDEQPYPMTTGSGELYALPVSLELNDVHALWERHLPGARYARLLTESAEVLCEDGASNGRLLVLHLHPWLIGQPFRIRDLDAALGAITARSDVWAAHAGDIIDWYREHRPEEATP